MSRKQKHVKARQAAQARAARNIKQLGTYSHANLAKTADQQLVNIAKTLGQEWERQKAQTIAEAKATTYHATAAEKPTKKDYMIANRASISDAQIASEPIAKRRKLLRQQQRKINAARGKINEWNRAQAMPKVSVYDQRVAEMAGTTGDMGYSGNLVVPSKLTDFLSMTNVLDDEAFVRAQLKGGHRKEILAQMHDAAEILGLRTERDRNHTGAMKRKGVKPETLYGKGEWPVYMSKSRYVMFGKVIGASLGTKRLKRFNSLTAAQKRAFIEQTDAPHIVFGWTDYDETHHTFRPVFKQNTEGYERARRNFDRWMTEAQALA